MTVAVSAPQWPSGLLAVGPEHDREVLLRGRADIAGAPYAVYAIRIDPISMSADLRGDVPTGSYATSEVRSLFDQLAELTELTDPALVHLETGAHALLVLPERED